MRKIERKIQIGINTKKRNRKEMKSIRINIETNIETNNIGRINIGIDSIKTKIIETEYVETRRNLRNKNQKKIKVGITLRPKMKKLPSLKKKENNRKNYLNHNSKKREL